jgi:hypothetical protein
VRDTLESRLSFSVMLALSVYVFLFVPQITNLWKQLPPWGEWWARYVLYLVPLLAFYLGSVFVVLGGPVPLPPPLPLWGWARDFFTRVAEGVSAAWRFLLRLATKHRAIRWAVVASFVGCLVVFALVWFLAVVAPQWVAGSLLSLTTAPHEGGRPLTRWERARRRAARFLSKRTNGALALVVGLVALGTGAVSDSSFPYPLAGAFCHSLGLLLAATGVWLLSGCDEPPAEGAGQVGRGRFGWAGLLLAGLGALGVGLVLRWVDFHTSPIDTGLDWQWRGLLLYLIGSLCRGLGAVLTGLGLYLLLDDLAAARTRQRRGAWVRRAGLVLLVGGWFWPGPPAALWVRPLCYGLGVGLFGIGVGLLYQGAEPGRAADGTPSGRWYVGRLLGWLLLTTAFGEALWAAAASDWLGRYFSYRLYSIWAVVQALTFLVLLGLLIDRLRELYTSWPIRQIAAAALVIGLWGFTRWETLAPNEAEAQLTHDQLAAARQADEQAAKNPKAAEERANHWFQQFQARVESIPEGEGPVVLVAASGGGSRAAIFTGLALDALRRTPLDPTLDLGPPGGRRTWADNVVLVSSVSGGSLATAWYVHRLGPAPDGRPFVALRDSGPVAELHNTTGPELLSHLSTLAAHELTDYPTKLRDDLVAKLAANPADQPSVDHELAVRLGKVGVLLETDPPGLRAADPEELYRAYEGLLRARAELLAKRGAGRNDRDAPAKAAGPTYLRNADVDEVYLDTLTQLIARLRSDALARQFQVWKAPPKQEAVAKAWVFQSQLFDEMCLDFMAPLLRGTLSPTLDRGDALARFWTHRFRWYNATNVNGYASPVGGWNYRPQQPLVLFNTCDVADGSRLVVGFPAVPDDFWAAASDDRKATHSRPKPINEVAPNFRVSLARAVRLSSNFPFGLRVSEVKRTRATAGDSRRHVHMLDGGVIDNTGLDTIYELFKALQWHARSAESPYGAKARATLAALRKRGVVILEVDSGAKPSPRTPPWWDPLGGPREPLQALENASYTNAEVVKQFYVKEVRDLLSRNLQALQELGPEVNTSLAVFNEQLAGTTTVHLVFQCNHYLPGQDLQDEEVMTAWALGPYDKAQIVQRFLIQMEVWDRHRRDAYRDVRHYLDQFAAVEALARKTVLLDLVPTLVKQYDQLGRDVRDGKDPKEIRQRKELLDRRLAHVQEEVTRAADKEVNRDWEELQRRAKRAQEQLAQGPPPKPVRWTNLSLPELVQMGAENVGPWAADVRADAAAQQSRKNANRQLLEQLKVQTGGTRRDPQWKYDLSTQRTKAMLESRVPR